MRTKTMNNSNNTSVQVHNFEFVRINGVCEVIIFVNSFAEYNTIVSKRIQNVLYISVIFSDSFVHATEKLSKTVRIPSDIYLRVNRYHEFNRRVLAPAEE